MKRLSVLLFIGVASTLAFESPVTVKDQRIGTNNPGRITNGYPAAEGEVPYIVGLSLQNDGGNNGWWCGGSIIAHTWVLTAAHCTDGADYVTIYYGSTWRTKPQFTLVVDSRNFAQHKEYSSHTLYNDISLIRTPHIDFTALVNKIELPSHADRFNSYAEYFAVVSGWGKISDDSGVSDILYRVDVQITENSECADYYGNSITPNHICYTAHNGKGSCNGDSGGPLVTFDGNRQVGIVSFGSHEGCFSNRPKGLTRVTAYLDWIENITGLSF